MLKSTILAAAAVLLSGCVSSLLETNPPKPRYLIEASDVEDGAQVAWSLIVDDPNASRAYDTTKIAVSRAPGRIEYFSGGEWAGPAPRMFQSAVIESFQDSGRILAVGDRVDIPFADFTLQTDIRRMKLNLAGGARNAELAVYARLSNGRGKIYAGKLFSASMRASTSSGDDVAAAFDTAFDDVISNIASWTLREGEAAAAAP